MLLFLKASITGGAARDLFDTLPTIIQMSGHTRDGRFIAPCTAIRHKAPDEAPAADAAQAVAEVLAVRQAAGLDDDKGERTMTARSQAQARLLLDLTDVPAAHTDGALNTLYHAIAERPAGIGSDAIWQPHQNPLLRLHRK